MMDKQALEYIVGLGKTEIVEVNGLQYSTKGLSRITYPAPVALEVTTLTAMVDYIRSKVDFQCELNEEGLIIHVVNPTEVRLESVLTMDNARERYMEAKAMLPNNVKLAQFMDIEDFNIMLQSAFVETTDRQLLLRVSGNVRDEGVKTSTDDGVTQVVNMKTGVLQVDPVKVPNPVSLAPYRTFPEVIQPESRFIFRMQAGPKAALFSADGGAWRNRAMEGIKVFLHEQLIDIPNIFIIS